MIRLCQPTFLLLEKLNIVTLSFPASWFCIFQPDYELTRSAGIDRAAIRQKHFGGDGHVAVACPPGVKFRRSCVVGWSPQGKAHPHLRCPARATAQSRLWPASFAGGDDVNPLQICAVTAANGRKLKTGFHKEREVELSLATKVVCWDCPVRRVPVAGWQSRQLGCP